MIPPHLVHLLMVHFLGGQDETGLSDDFPNNKRSVINREMKKDLRSDKISSNKDNDSDKDPGDQNQDQ